MSLLFLHHGGKCDAHREANFGEDADDSRPQHGIDVEIRRMIYRNSDDAHPAESLSRARFLGELAKEILRLLGEAAWTLIIAAATVWGMSFYIVIL